MAMASKHGEVVNAIVCILPLQGRGLPFDEGAKHRSNAT